MTLATTYNATGDLGLAFMSAAAALEPTLPAGISIRHHGLRETAPVAVEQRQLTHLVQTLISASVEVAPSGSIIDIDAENQPGLGRPMFGDGMRRSCVVLHVTDQSGTIDSLAIARAMWSAMNDDPDELDGLARAYAMALVAGARIDVECNRGRFTRVSCYLPRPLRC